MAKKSMAPLLLLGGGAAMLALSKKKKDSASMGVVVNEDCSIIEIVDDEVLDARMHSVYEEQRAAGIEDPFTIADAMAIRVAPSCRKFPEEMRTLDELEIYARGVKHATLELVREGKLSIVDLPQNPRAAEYGNWLEAQKTRLTIPPPQGPEIVFIADTDEVLMGAKWMDEVFYPMMENVRQNLPNLFTEGTAILVAAMVMKETTFIDENGNVIDVDLKTSTTGVKFLDAVTEMIKEYVRESK